MPLTPEEELELQQLESEFGNNANSGSLTPEEEEELASLEAEFSTPQQPQPDLSMVESGLRGAYDTSTFGFGDEIQAIGATPVDMIASAVYGDDVSIKDSYDRALKATRNREEQAQQQNPISYGTGQVAGAIGQVYKLSGTKAATAVGNAIERGLLSQGQKGAKLANNAAKVGATGLTGATSSGLYGYGSGEGESRPDSASEAAILGGVVGGAAPVVASAIRATSKGAKNVIKGLTARDADALETAAQSIKQSSNQAYQAMRDTGAILKPDTVNNLVTNIDNTLAQSGKLNASLHGDTISIIDDVRRAASKGELGLDEIDQYRQLLSQAVQKNTSKIDGANPDARTAQIAINALDDIVDNIKPQDLARGDQQAIEALNKGRSEYARYKKFNTISNIIQKSEGDANYIKRELKKLADDPKRTRGYSKEEKEALREAARLSAGEGILKGLGKFGFDIGGPSRLGNTALPVGGIVLGQPGLTAAGTVARQGQKAIARGKAEELLRTIESGGKVTNSQINALPPKDAMKVLEALKRGSAMTVGTAANALTQ